MKILLNTSTFQESSSDPSPTFINNLIKNFDENYEIFVLYPHKTKILKKKYIGKNIKLLPYKYIYPLSISDLSVKGLYPSIKKNKLNILKVTLLCISQFLHLSFYVLKIKPDLIYSHWIFPQAFFSSIIGKIFNVKTVFTSHGSDLKILINNKFLGKFILNYTFLNSEKFTFVSSKAIDMLTDTPMLKNIKNKYAIIPMGVEDIFFNEVSTSKKDTDSLSLLYFGRFIEYKGIDVLIKSIRKIVDREKIKVNVELIGEGINKKNYNEQVNSLGLKKIFSFLPFMNQAELIKRIDNADFVIVPSKITKSEYEAGPLTLIEAMARKKICIVSNSIGFSSYLDESNCVLFESNNAEDLYEKILFASKLSGDLSRQIRNNSLKTAKEFKFENISKKVQNYLFT